MYNNYDYPCGADNEYAPWNEPMNATLEFDCHVEVSLEKDVKIGTDMYDNVDDGECCYTDTSNVDWSGEYARQHWSIEELLLELKVYVKKDLSTKDEHSAAASRLIAMLEDIEGWKVVETIVSEA